MPIYEYRCASCGHQQEFLQKLADAPLTICTQCGKPAFSKMVTAAGFHLKGSGWYATDFKNSGARPAAKTAEPSATGAKAAEPSAAGAKSAESSSTDAKSGGETKSDGEKKAAPSAPAAGG